jgi:hypothetical protein
LIKCYVISEFVQKCIFKNKLEVLFDWIVGVIQRPEAKIRARLNWMLKELKHRQKLEEITHEWQYVYKHLVENSRILPDRFFQIRSESDFVSELMQLFTEYDSMGANEISLLWYVSSFIL